VTACTTSGYFSLNNTCVACDIGARSCVNATFATSCFSGFYLTGQTCVPIATGVLTSGNPVTTTPAEGYYLVGGVPF
jgi:hypothetical protein